MRISTKSQYGLRAMVYLAKVFKKDKVFPLREIAKKEDISFDYLEKIISKLEKTGLVKSKKGVQGGYSLARPPRRIKLGEIMRTLEGEMILVKCLAKMKKSICPREKKCLAKNFWRKIQNSLEKTLDSMTLAELISPEGKPRASYGARK